MSIIHWSPPYQNLLEEVRSILESDQGKLRPGLVSLDDAVIGALSELTNAPPAVQISGWDYFNQATGGLRPKEFTILCGATGVGKTQILADLSARLVVGGVKHFVASVETGHTDFIKRMISALARRDYNSGDIYPQEEIDKLNKSYAMIFRSKLIELTSYSSKVHPDKMLCDLFYANQELKCKVAILDNLNFFLPFVDSSESNCSMDKTIHDFIVFCKAIDMHIIMVMHPKKTDHGRVESEFDIKGSSGAVQEAHNVLLFNRISKNDSERWDPGLYRELKFAKIRRRGKYVNRRIIYRADDCRFTEEAFL